MKKFFVITLIAFTFALAQSSSDIIAKVSLIVSATDLTNLTKTNYAVYYDVADSLKDTADTNIDLCTNSNFKKSIGEFACKRGISYSIVGDKDSADIVISETYSTDKPNVLSVCIGLDTANCDVVMKPKYLKIDVEGMKAKGFAPDPTLKIGK